MSNAPKDCNQRIIGSKARGIVHYRFPKENWEYHECTGTDHGIDCIIELVEKGEFINKKIEGQIKGCNCPQEMKTQNAFSFSMEVKTIKYGLGSSSAFLLFYVDNSREIVYYLPIQDYFIANPNLFELLNSDQKTISVHIPLDNVVSDDDYDLQQIAKSVYVDGPTSSLRKV